jgi:hypothetical protein
MKDIVDAVEKIGEVVEAVQEGVRKFEAVLPVLTKQQLDVFAKKKLHSTLPDFLDATKVEYTGDLLIVEIDKDSWLANAVEEGADPFSMKETHLNSPKAKISKKGFRYMSIPMEKFKNAPSGGTDKSAMWQAKINEVLTKPKYGISQLKVKLDGSATMVQPVISGDPPVKGLYRMQNFDSPEAVMGKKKPRSTQFVMFRTISDNPASISEWQHPGLRPAKILDELQQWLEATVEPLLERMISDEIGKVI